jgi:hypothetical protein
MRKFPLLAGAHDPNGRLLYRSHVTASSGAGPDQCECGLAPIIHFGHVATVVLMPLYRNKNKYRTNSLSERIWTCFRYEIGHSRSGSKI